MAVFKTGIKRIWAKPLLLAFVLAFLRIPALAQSPPSGSLTGKLTDLHSSPLAGASVLLRNRVTGALARTTTARDGAYSFTALDPGEYTIEADSATLGHGRLDGIVVSAGHKARVQMAMQLTLAPPEPVHSVFLENPPLSPPSTAARSAALLTTLSAAPLIDEAPRQPSLSAPPQPGPIYNSPPTQTPLLSATLSPAPRPPTRISALPTTELPKPTPQTPDLKAPGAPGPGSPQTGLGPSGGGLDSHTWESANLHAQAAPSQLAFIRAAESLPNLAATLSIATGLRAAAQWNLPPQARNPIPIQTAAQQPDPASSAATTTLSAAELQSLPATGRRWQDFVLDTPAAAAPAGSSQTSLRGASQQPADIAIDGVTTSLAFGGTSSSSPGAPGQSASGLAVSEPSGMGQAWSGGRGFQVSESAIRQVETVAGNVEAKGARAAGGRVNVETQRGSNEFHGQGFLFDRQNTWGARNPFTQWVKETSPATYITTPVFTPQPFTPPDHEITWGLGLGSRIRRDKLFWFAALDSNQRNDPAISTVKWPVNFFAQPSNDQMQLLGAQLGTNNSAALQKYSQMLETLDGLLGPAPRVSAQWVGFARIDWQAAERNRFTLEAIGANWNSPGGGITRVSETYGNHSLGSSQASQEWLLARWEAFLTPNLLAVTQASAGRAILSAHAETPSAFEQTLNQNVWGQLPQIVVDSRYGFTIGNPSRFGQGSYPDERLFRVQESVDWVRNSLLVRAGFDVGHNTDATGLLRNQTGTYYYANVENFVSDALTFGAFGFSGALRQIQPAQLRRNRQGLARHHRPAPRPWLPALLLLLLANHGPHQLESEHQRLGRLRHRPVAAQQACRPLGRPALGARTVAAAHLHARQPRASAHRQDCPISATTGARASASPSVRSETHWPVLRLGYGMYYGRTENATLETVLTQTGSAQRRPELLHAPHRQSECRWRSAVPLCLCRRAAQPGQAGSSRVRSQLPQSRSTPGRRIH